jgi:hypothetical protein
MLPSRAYCVGSSPSFHATVVRRSFSDLTGVSPVFISMKAPVP